MNFAYNNLESTTHYAPIATPQYNTPSYRQTTVKTPVYTAPVIEIEQLSRPNNERTDIILVGKKPQGGAEFFVYGNKKNGLANDIAAVLAKIVAEQTHVSGGKADVYIADLKREKRFIEEEIDLELGTF